MAESKNFRNVTKECEENSTKMRSDFALDVRHKHQTPPVKKAATPAGRAQVRAESEIQIVATQLVRPTRTLCAAELL